MRNEKLHAAVARSMFQRQNVQNTPDRTALGRSDVKKRHAPVARKTLPSQNVENTPCSEQFWKLGRGKMAGHCGAKRIFKTRNTKLTMLGALLEVGAWKNGRSLWCEAYFQIKRYKAHHARSTFGSWGVEKWQVTVVRSVFSKQEIQSTPCSEHFWKLGRGKMAGHCGAKHIFKTRNTKHTMLGALLEVGAWKNGRSLWCEAYFQIKRYKAHHARSTFGSWGVEKWQVTVVRSVFSKQEIQSTPCSEHSWKLGRGKMAGHCGAKRIFKTRNTKHTMLGALLEVGAWKNGRSLWCEAYFQNKKYKAHHDRSTFGSWGVEKWQVTVARSVFSKQEIQSTPCSEQFWKLGRGKMAGHCGAKRIFKTKNTKHTMIGALLEVGAWKNGRSLWCEAYFQNKKYKAYHARSSFGSWGVEKWQVTVVRSVFSKQEIQSIPCSEQF